VPRLQRRESTNQIIERIRAGEKYREIAASFGVSPQRVGELAKQAGIRRRSKERDDQLPEERKRRLARQLIRSLVGQGYIVKPECCLGCGKPCRARDLEAHHPRGHDDPRDIVWLCRPCHRQQHPPVCS